MFVQVIQGRVSDASGLRQQFDKWESELAQGAPGWLGTTAGVTDKGDWLAVVRFDSPEAAQRNSQRPEQGKWWADTEKYFSESVKFWDCADVDLMLDGGSDNAGFVQVIQGWTKNPQKLLELSRDFEKKLPGYRPDIIGGLLAQDKDGSFTEVAWFQSEKEARAGESQPMPADVQPLFDEWTELGGDLNYLDITDPWLQSP